MHDKIISIKEAVDSNPGLANIRNTLKESEVIEKFHTIFPEMQKVVKPVNVIKKVLLLKVESSVLRSELKFNQTTMIGKINKYFKEERIKSVRFVS